MPSGSKREVQVLETDSSLVLALHNKYRVEHGSPPLTWDNALASYALDWSQHCVFQHSAGPYGENLAQGQSTWETAITAWYDEEALYDFGNPGYSESTGHFTQLIWKSTERVGCAAVYCSSLGRNFYTCEYDPRGNIVSSSSDSGKYFAQNVQ